MALVTTYLQIALESDPHKKGVQLYRVTREVTHSERYVWARSNQEALASVAKVVGFAAFPFRVGVQMETPLDLSGEGWEGLNELSTGDR